MDSVYPDQTVRMHRLILIYTAYKSQRLPSPIHEHKQCRGPVHLTDDSHMNILLRPTSLDIRDIASLKQPD